MRSRGPGSTLSLVQLLLGFLALFQQQQQICLVEKHLLFYSAVLSRSLEGFGLGSKPGKHLSLRMNGGWRGLGAMPCRACSSFSFSPHGDLVPWVPRAPAAPGGTEVVVFPPAAQKPVLPGTQLRCFFGALLSRPGTRAIQAPFHVRLLLVIHVRATSSGFAPFSALD